MGRTPAYIAPHSCNFLRSAALWQSTLLVNASNRELFYLFTHCIFTSFLLVQLILQMLQRRKSGLIPWRWPTTAAVGKIPFRGLTKNLHQLWVSWEVRRSLRRQECPRHIESDGGTKERDGRDHRSICTDTLKTGVSWDPAWVNFKPPTLSIYKTFRGQRWHLHVCSVGGFKWQNGQKNLSREWRIFLWSTYLFQGSQFQQWVKPSKHSKTCEGQSDNSCSVNVDANELKVDMDWLLSCLESIEHFSSQINSQNVDATSWVIW